MNNEQKQNTLILKKVLEDKIAKKEDPLILDSWIQPCGTFGCVAGDTYISIFGMDSGSKYFLSDLMFNISSMATNYFEVFGIDRFFIYQDDLDPEYIQQLDVFGTSVSGTLQQRLDYVNEQLAL